MPREHWDPSDDIGCVDWNRPNWLAAERQKPNFYQLAGEVCEKEFELFMESER